MLKATTSSQSSGDDARRKNGKTTHRDDQENPSETKDDWRWLRGKDHKPGRESSVWQTFKETLLLLLLLGEMT